MLGDDRATYEEPPGVRLVVNADDFGRTEAINAAVAQAHCKGILTSASLMVAASAASDAVAVARANPHLAVGLHLVLLSGRATLPAIDIPHLVDEDGLFSRTPVRTGLRYFFGRKTHAELNREIRAQFEAFQATGLRLSHVDGHHHMHLHPTIFRLLLPLAGEYGAGAVRVSVSDELLFSLRQDRRHLLVKLGWKIAYSLLCRWARRSLRCQPLPAADRVYGLMQSGSITKDYLIRLMHRLASRSTTTPGDGASPSAHSVFEVFCHPSQDPLGRRLGPNPGDLEALLSSAVRAAVDAESVLLTTYPQAWTPLADEPSDDVLADPHHQPADPTPT